MRGGALAPQLITNRTPRHAGGAKPYDAAFFLGIQKENPIDGCFHAADRFGRWRPQAQGMADSFESVKRRAQEAAGSGAQDRSPALRRLDPRQRKALELFRDSNTITSRDIEALFGIYQRAARNLLTAWVDSGFLAIADPAKKSRKYGLAGEYREIVG